MSLRKYLISSACILLLMSAVMVHVSHAYKYMDMAISLSFKLYRPKLYVQASFRKILVVISFTDHLYLVQSCVNILVMTMTIMMMTTTTNDDEKSDDDGGDNDNDDDNDNKNGDDDDDER